jgi:hypothetical protein
VYDQWVSDSAMVPSVSELGEGRLEGQISKEIQKMNLIGV